MAVVQRAVLQMEEEPARLEAGRPWDEHAKSVARLPGRELRSGRVDGASEGDRCASRDGHPLLRAEWMATEVDREMEVVPLFVVDARRGHVAARDHDLELALMEQGRTLEASRHPAAIARRRLLLVRRGGDEASARLR